MSIALSLLVTAASLGSTWVAVTYIYKGLSAEAACIVGIVGVISSIITLLAILLTTWGA